MFCTEMTFLRIETAVGVLRHQRVKHKHDPQRHRTNRAGLEHTAVLGLQAEDIHEQISLDTLCVGRETEQAGYQQ